MANDSGHEEWKACYHKETFHGRQHPTEMLSKLIVQYPVPAEANTVILRK